MPHADDREIADASSLFEDHPARGRADDAPIPGDPTSGPPGTAAGDGYELADPVPGAAGPDRRLTPIQGWEERPGPSRGKEPRALTPAPVDRPWSRLAEWGPALGRILLVVALTGAAVVLFVGGENPLTALPTVAIGLGLAVALSYPIAITLERPVRMTPEHALRDFYGALAHHLPHYRRMWLLLSSAGRASPEFASYGEFRSYWARTLAGLKGGQGRAFAPVAVRIEEFKSEKSAGLEAIAASYTLVVSLRGREDDGPLYSARVETTLSRGPDRMWYLDDGQLPRPRS